MEEKDLFKDAIANLLSDCDSEHFQEQGYASMYQKALSLWAEIYMRTKPTSLPARQFNEPQLLAVISLLELCANRIRQYVDSGVQE